MRLIKKLILGLGIIAAITSCKKDTRGPGNTLSYKVDGVLKTTQPEASYYTYDNSLLIYAGKTGGEEMAIYIFTNLKTGSFQFEHSKDRVLGTYEPGGFVSDSGKLVINSFDGKRVNGTFEFRGRNNNGTANITEGQFSVKVTNLTEFILPPDDSGYNVIRHRAINAPR